MISELNRPFTVMIKDASGVEITVCASTLAINTERERLDITEHGLFGTPDSMRTYAPGMNTMTISMLNACVSTNACAPQPDHINVTDHATQSESRPASIASRRNSTPYYERDASRPLAGNERKEIMRIIDTRRISNSNLYDARTFAGALVDVLTQQKYKFEQEEHAFMMNALQCVCTTIETARARRANAFKKPHSDKRDARDSNASAANESVTND